MKNILMGLLILMTLIIGGITIYNTLKIYPSEWVCIVQECTKQITGDEWVNQNCKLGEDNQMICEFKYQEQNIRVPLSGVNTSLMSSCAEYKCSSKVLVSYEK